MQTTKRDTTNSKNRRRVVIALTELNRELAALNREVVRLWGMRSGKSPDDMVYLGRLSLTLQARVQSHRAALAAIIASLPEALRGHSRLTDAQRLLDAVDAAVDDARDVLAA